MSKTEIHKRIRHTLLIWIVTTLVYFILSWLVHEVLSHNYWQHIVYAVLTTVAYALVSVILTRQLLYQMQRTQEQLQAIIASERESEERFRRLADASFEGIVIHDHGTILEANRSFASMFDQDPAALVGRSLFDFIAAESYALLQEQIHSDWPEACEASGRKQDGSSFDIEVIARSMPYQGRSASVVAIRDITERKQVIEALRESEQRYRQMFEKNQAVKLLVDPSSGAIVDANPAAASFYGYSLEQLRCMHISDINTLPRDRMATELVRVFKEEQLYFQFRHRLASGEIREVEVYASPIDYQGRHILFSVIHDVTERKRAEEALQRANEQLLSWVAELERRTYESTLLSEMGDLLQTCLSAEEAYSVIARSTQKLFPNEAGMLSIINASRNLVQAVAGWGDRAMDKQLFAPEECWALRRGRVHILEAPPYGLPCQHLTNPPAAGAICVPLIAQGEALGVLHLQRTAQETEQGEGLHSPLPESKQLLAVTVGEHIALALANLRLQETLRSQAIRDPLTGLFNRRYMEESLQRELLRALRNQRPLGVIMIDLDLFKRFNDTFGHAAGDSLLRELGSFLSSQIRGEDIACRYGGEEFTIILPEASLEDTRRRAEELREGIKRLRIDYQRRSLNAVSASLGVAAYPEHSSSAELLLRVADAALYQAKFHGGDQVVVAPLSA